MNPYKPFPRLVTRLTVPVTPHAARPTAAHSRHSRCSLRRHNATALPATAAPSAHVLAPQHSHTAQVKACSVPRTERTSSETIVAQGVVTGYATAGCAPPAKKIAVDQSAVENSTADADVAASAALAAADKASANSAGTIDAIDAGARAEEVGASAGASTPSVTLHVATADEVFPASDFPPFNLEEIFGGDRNNSPIGYLVGDSAKAVFTQDEFEERLKVFQSSVYKDCEWVSGDSYFKREDRIRSACHQLHCLD
ncbi:hypothetical protein H4S07_003903 [Coemansia furcata]|uniref:Uncharacterized protein n=1 Tax=Coemansia furcata TaxID=417177 RepID=A0ACC1LDP4_9FUNG|nr:hypothetical protein H4S07_003903 [Coemansia furcata]